MKSSPLKSVLNIDRDIIQKARPRFWKRVQIASPKECWVWVGTRSAGGYGMFSVTIAFKRRVGILAHRFAFETERMPIPLDKVLDHICRNRACVNPEHLRLITFRENILCGIGPTANNANRTNCKHGHPLVPGNLYKDPRGGSGRGFCRQCTRDRAQARYRRTRVVKKPRT